MLAGAWVAIDALVDVGGPTKAGHRQEKYDLSHTIAKGWQTTPPHNKGV